MAENGLLDGRVRLRQPVTGYRAGMDAALLAAAVDARPGERVLDVGCGAGAVMLQIAARRPGVGVAGLERDPEAAALAVQNASLNAVDAQVHVGAVGAGFAALRAPSFDWAVSNPPFFDDPAALRAPAPGKRAAWMADDGLGAWTGLCLDAVRDGGRIVVIHRADRLADLLALLAPRSGSFAVRAIQPHNDAPAKRVLVRAVRNGRAPLRLLPPLVLHARDRDGHAPAAEAILRGHAALDW